MYQVIRLNSWGDEFSVDPIGVFSTLKKAKDAMMKSVHDCEEANAYGDPGYCDDDGLDGGCQSGPINKSGTKWTFFYGDDCCSKWVISKVTLDKINLYRSIEMDFEEPCEIVMPIL